MRNRQMISYKNIQSSGHDAIFDPNPCLAVPPGFSIRGTILPRRRVQTLPGLCRCSRFPRLPHTCEKRDGVSHTTPSRYGLNINIPADTPVYAGRSGGIHRDAGSSRTERKQ